ncbi:M28 family peptidase [Aequorivita echinoideorum]|uniref:M28 family peptidase n=1 Tax=Aequorivita echinoideorum TaxID=1549647 RepID=A0ABS5S2I4_9FLAO|nr:M28 family peptidase [Aequorivita echinoideorum]MBT0607389.1 M28 family peptidase [Aequorivita echinoideorum]
MKNLALLFFLLITLQLISQTEKEKVEATVKKSTIESHIYFLADDSLKGRETGTAENKIAAAYLANTLKKFGVKPIPGTDSYYQRVPLTKTPSVKNANLNIDGKNYPQLAVLQANDIDFTGDAIFLGYGLENDYEGKNTEGKIIIIKAGDANTNTAQAAFGLREQKQQFAARNGVKAIIELVDTNENVWAFIDHNFNADKLEIASKNIASENKNPAYLWVFDPKGLNAKNLESKNNHNIQLQLEKPAITEIISQNVIGIVEGTDAKLKDEYIIYAAHYDHVGIGAPDQTGDTIYNGARDNAVGTTTVLSMAENLAKYPTKRSALFILFTGEEKGLLGSKYYIENPVLPLNKMVFCFNSDNGGYNDTSITTIIGLERTTASKNIKDAATAFSLRATDDPAPEQGLFDRSDNVHFAKAGIPAPTYSLGFTSFDAEITKYYHQASDEADTLDFDYLLKFFKSYVLSGRLIGNDSEKPIWTKGDKYEAAGKSLYEN